MELIFDIVTSTPYVLSVIVAAVVFGYGAAILNEADDWVPSIAKRARSLMLALVFAMVWPLALGLFCLLYFVEHLAERDMRREHLQRYG